MILANKSGFDATPILDAVRESLLNRTKSKPTPPKPLDCAALQAYTGEYALAPLGKLVITIEPGKLQGQVTGQPTVELRPTRTDVFELVLNGKKVGEVAFLRDATGKVTFFSQGLRAFPRAKN